MRNNNNNNTNTNTHTNTNSNSKKRIVSFILVIAIAVALGVAVNSLWNFIEKKSYPDNYDDIITRYSEEYGVPEYIIYATIKVESDFEHDAISSAGAMGLMQMMPSTFEWLTGEEHLDEGLSKRKLEDPEVSIRYGTYYLAYLHRKFNYNWDCAFAAYNGGEGNVAKWLADDRYSDGEGNLTDIPFKETKNYVKKINSAIDTYKKLYPEKTEIKEK